MDIDVVEPGRGGTEEGIIVFKNVRETSERARRGFKAKKRLSSDVRG